MLDNQDPQTPFSEQAGLMLGLALDFRESLSETKVGSSEEKPIAHPKEKAPLDFAEGV